VKFRRKLNPAIPENKRIELYLRIKSRNGY
jgi:hypothetical protein